MENKKSDEKAWLKNEMAKIMLEDRLFRLEFYNKLGTSSQISMEQIEKNYKSLMSLQGLIQRYKELQNPGKSVSEWLTSLQEVVEKTQKEYRLSKDTDFVKNLEDLNYVLKAGSNPESEKLLDIPLCFLCGENCPALFTLDCGHSFCEKCLFEWARNLYYKCGNSSYFCMKCPMSHCYCLADFEEVQKFLPKITGYWEPQGTAKPEYCLMCIARCEFVKTTSNCKHVFCKDCLKGYYEYVTSGSIITYYDAENDKALALLCPFHNCKQLIPASSILSLYDAAYVKVLKENAKEEFLVLKETNPKAIEERVKQQIEYYTAVKRCFKCKKKEDALKWRGKFCTPECTFGACKEHVKLAISEMKALYKCLSCSAEISETELAALKSQ